LISRARCGHRRAHDANALEELAHGERHLEVGRAQHFQDPIFCERLTRHRHRIDREEQVRKTLELDAVRTDRPHSPPGAVVAEEHHPPHRRQPADRLAQAAQEGVRRRALTDAQEQVRHDLKHLDVAGARVWSSGRAVVGSAGRQGAGWG
jgi:hypothetical protein